MPANEVADPSALARGAQPLAGIGEFIRRARHLPNAARFFFVCAAVEWESWERRT